MIGLPRDNFRRERERHIREAIQFNKLYWKIIRECPLPGRRVYGCGEIGENNSLKEASVDKTFHCTNCGQMIVATSEDRKKRLKVSCPRCDETYKLHPPYATHEGETIQYKDDSLNVNSVNK